MSSPDMRSALLNTSEDSAADAGRRFAVLAAGIILIFVVAENLRKMKSLPALVRQSTEDKKMVAAWTTFLALLYAGYVYQPEAEDPSVVITFGAGIELFAMCLLYAMPRKTAEAGAGPSGDSAEFALLMAVALGLRLSSTTRFLGYLPTDATGDGCYQALEGLSAFLALRGLAGMGLTPKQAVRCFVAIALCGLFSMCCYGDLNRRPIWDRAYACGAYVEFVSWGFLAASLLKTGPDRSLKLAFIFPVIGQAATRGSFWYLALDELKSFSQLNQIRLMEYFGETLITIHSVTTVGWALVGLYLVYGKKTTSPLPVAEPVKSDAEPFLAFVSSIMGGGPSAPPGMMPIRAVFEEGKLRVEYEPAGGEVGHALA